MSRLIRFANHSFIRDVEDSWDDSNRFKDGSQYPYADGNCEAVHNGSLSVNKEMKAPSVLPVCS